MIPSLDKTQKILSKHFENHTYMETVRPLVLKRVEKAYNEFPTRMVRICRDDLVQKFYLVYGSLGIMRG